MQVWIYKMRHDGQRLGAIALGQQRPSQGWLVYGRSMRLSSRGKSWEVHLRESAEAAQRSDAGDTTAPLFFARLVHADGVLHIAGYEDHGRPQTKAKPWYRPQSWLVGFDSDTARAYLQRTITHLPPDRDEDAEEVAADALIARLMSEDASPYR